MPFYKANECNTDFHNLQNNNARDYDRFGNFSVHACTHDERWQQLGAGAVRTRGRFRVVFVHFSSLLSSRRDVLSSGGRASWSRN